MDIDGVVWLLLVFACELESGPAAIERAAAELRGSRVVESKTDLPNPTARPAVGFLFTRQSDGANNRYRYAQKSICEVPVVSTDRFAQSPVARPDFVARAPLVQC